MSETAQRFTLDETKAAEWLAGQVQQFERWEASETSEAPELEIGSGYNPQECYESGYDTQSILYYAQANGVIAGPGSVEFDYYDDDCGYCWLVYLDGPGSLKLSTYFTKLKWLGDGSEPGAAAALGVLREAVASANGLLDDLDAYIAAKSAA